MRVTSAIRDFLATRVPSDLLQRVSLPGLECQVNVSQGEGERTEKRGTFSDGIETWWNLRIPKGADSEPTWTDYELRWPLVKHAEAVGFTGWDWENRLTRWVGFDFDALTGHAAGVGVSDDDLDRVRVAVEGVPWVEVRRSKSGQGLHLYVDVEPVATKNHTEHAALARCILGILSQQAEFDFASQVDQCGAVLWVWHKLAQTGGFDLVKAATEPLRSVPANWRDHVPVIRRKRNKVQVGGALTDSVEKLAATQSAVSLTEEHKQVIEALLATGYSTVWVQDHGLLQTHTKALELVHKELGLRGVYSTNSPGSDQTSFNCFCFPQDNGWKVYRFGQGISEAATWQQDGNGWTTCRYNVDPTLNEAAAANGGATASDGSFHFETAEEACATIRLLGQSLDLPAKFQSRTATVRPLKDGRLNIVLRKEHNEANAPDKTWAPKRGGWWEKVLNFTPEKPRIQVLDQDDYLRYLHSAADSKPIGWTFRGPDQEWVPISHENVKLVLSARQFSDAEIKQVMGASVERPWRQVCLPFQGEYPGGRLWNLNAPQLAYVAEEGDHPYWDAVLAHCFNSLELNSEWSIKNGVRTGRDYAVAWLSCLLRDPFSPLPYLFFFGPENSGKSTFHEAVSLLMTRGVMLADNAINGRSGFNGELAEAILCVIEEKNLKGEDAYSRIKEYVTGKTISIHAKGRTPYVRPNMTHWCQFANSESHCPVFPGDSRIVVLKVDKPTQEMPKEVLLDQLRTEAPAFLYTLLNSPLPTVEGRLRLPAIGTVAKSILEGHNKTALELFIEEKCLKIDGATVTFAQFYGAFSAWAEGEAVGWTKIRVSRHMPDDFPIGHFRGEKCIGNLSLTECEASVRLQNYYGKLVPKQ